MAETTCSQTWDLGQTERVSKATFPLIARRKEAEVLSEHILNRVSGFSDELRLASLKPQILACRNEFNRHTLAWLWLRRRMLRLRASN